MTYLNKKLTKLVKENIKDKEKNMGKVVKLFFNFEELRKKGLI